jgi:hypothetical protein
MCPKLEPTDGNGFSISDQPIRECPLPNPFIFEDWFPLRAFWFFNRTEQAVHARNGVNRGFRVGKPHRQARHVVWMRVRDENRCDWFSYCVELLPESARFRSCQRGVDHDQRFLCLYRIGICEDAHFPRFVSVNGHHREPPFKVRARFLKSLALASSHSQMALANCRTSSGCLDEIRFPSTTTDSSSPQMPPNCSTVGLPDSAGVHRVHGFTRKIAGR